MRRSFSLCPSSDFVSINAVMFCSYSYFFLSPPSSLSLSHPYVSSLAASHVNSISQNSLSDCLLDSSRSFLTDHSMPLCIGGCQVPSCHGNHAELDGCPVDIYRVERTTLNSDQAAELGRGLCLCQIRAKDHTQIVKLHNVAGCPTNLRNR